MPSDYQDTIKLEINTDMNGTNAPDYKQSANSLFHFMSKSKYLYEILKTKRISPRYYPEEAEHYKIDGLNNIAFPMICFCDIKLHRIFEHADYYGYYAISFSKDFSKTQKIQPILYLNENSFFFERFKKGLHTAYDLSDNESSIEFENISDAIVLSLSYMKRLKGIQKGTQKNFHDEQEWRYIPDLQETEMPSFLPNVEFEKTLLENYNNALLTMKEVGIRFEYSDIKYIILKSDKEREECIKHIISFDNISDMEKYLLISRIITFDDLRSDL